MSRYDKYDSKDGGFRALLAADWAGDLDTVYAVGLDVNGHVVPGAGNTGIVGVVVVTVAKFAGDVVDVMTDGEIVDFPGASGTVYTGADADGAVGTGAPGAGLVRLGHTVEDDRLIVRVAR